MREPAALELGGNDSSIQPPLEASEARQLIDEQKRWRQCYGPPQPPPTPITLNPSQSNSYATRSKQIALRGMTGGNC